MAVCVAVCFSVLQYAAVYCSMLQCVAVCCRVLQSVAARCSVLQYVAVCCSVLQHYAAVCCSMLQRAAFSIYLISTVVLSIGARTVTAIECDVGSRHEPREATKFLESLSQFYSHFRY